MAPQRRYISPTTVIIAGALFIFSSCGITKSFYRLVRTNQNGDDWDVLIFTQNWPVTVCLKWEAKYKDNVCNPSANISTWTIHGIWPTKLGTLGPFFCNASRTFNPDAIYGIQNQLEQHWSVIEKSKQHNKFWKHEWEKHGTCASEVPELFTEFDYFEQGLTWNNEYNITGMLTSSGIAPGKMYNISDVWAAVKKSVGKNPHLVCYNDPLSKVSHLLEVRICFTKTLNVTDCDGTKMENKWYFRRSYKLSDANYTDCSLDTLVYYPQVAPQPPPPTRQHLPKQHFLIDLLKFIQLLAWATS